MNNDKPSRAGVIALVVARRYVARSRGARIPRTPNGRIRMYVCARAKVPLHKCLPKTSSISFPFYPHKNWISYRKIRRKSIVLPRRRGGIKHARRKRRRRRYFCDHVVPPSGGAFDESNVLRRRVFDGLVREKNVSSTVSSSSTAINFVVKCDDDAMDEQRGEENEVERIGVFSKNCFEHHQPGGGEWRRRCQTIQIQKTRSEREASSGAARVWSSSRDESSLRENLRKIQRRKSRRGSGSFATNAVPRRGKHRRRIGRNVAVERPKTTSYIIGGRRGFVFCVRDDWSRQPRGRFESNRHRRHGVTVYSRLDVGVVFVRRARRVRRLQPTKRRGQTRKNSTFGRENRPPRRPYRRRHPFRGYFPRPRNLFPVRFARFQRRRFTVMARRRERRYSSRRRPIRDERGEKSQQKRKPARVSLLVEKFSHEMVTSSSASRHTKCVLYSSGT